MDTVKSIHPSSYDDIDYIKSHYHPSWHAYMHAKDNGNPKLVALDYHTVFPVPVGTWCYQHQV